MSNSAEIPDDIIYCCPLCSTPLGIKPAAKSDTSCPKCGHVVWFRKRDYSGVLVLEVSSGMVATNRDIDRVSEAVLDPDGDPNLVMDLSNLKFISSAFVAGLIALQRRVRAIGGRLILCGMHPIVRETLHGARLDSFFEIHDSVSEALEKL